jgi:hypothetical protein
MKSHNRQIKWINNLAMKTEGHIIRGKLTENSANLKQEN